MCGVECSVCGVECNVCGVECSVCGVECSMCGVEGRGGRNTIPCEIFSATCVQHSKYTRT